MTINLQNKLPDLPDYFINVIKESIVQSVDLAHKEILNHYNLIGAVDYYETEDELENELIEIFREIAFVGIKNDSTLSTFEVICYNQIFGDDAEGNQLLNLLASFKENQYKVAPNFITASIIYDGTHKTNVTGELFSVIYVVGLILSNLDYLLDPRREFEEDVCFESSLIMQRILLTFVEMELELTFRDELNKANAKYFIPIAEIIDEYYGGGASNQDIEGNDELETSLEKHDYLIKKTEGLTAEKIEQISFELTPAKYLNDSQRYMRSTLLNNQLDAYELEIMHDRYNDFDKLALEVYCNKVFIGHVRKNNNPDIADFIYSDSDLSDLRVSFYSGKLILVREVTTAEILKKNQEKMQEDLRRRKEIITKKNQEQVEEEKEKIIQKYMNRIEKIEEEGWSRGFVSVIQEAFKEPDTRYGEGEISSIWGTIKLIKEQPFGENKYVFVDRDFHA